MERHCQSQKQNIKIYDIHSTNFVGCIFLYNDCHGLLKVIFPKIIKDHHACGVACNSYAFDKPFQRALGQRQQNSLIGLVYATRLTGGFNIRKAF